MEFWEFLSEDRSYTGVEVKSGEALKVIPGDGMVLHLSQASLGELKKEKGGSESVYLYVIVDGKKLVLGTLFTDKLPQQQFDLVFDRDFELSHTGKSGSVYFYGYKACNPFDEDLVITEFSGEESDESDSEDIPLPVAENGKPDSKAKEVKPVVNEKANAAKDKESDASKQKVKIVEPKKDDETSDDDLMSEDDDEDDEEDDDDESGKSDEETPQKAAPSKKRAAESAIKTPVQEKKAKVTPQKTDGKKGATHVATPHPSKQAGKKTAGDKSNQQTQKSGGAHSCGSCKKTFGSEKGLESHNKAKHAGGK